MNCLKKLFILGFVLLGMTVLFAEEAVEVEEGVIVENIEPFSIEETAADNCELIIESTQPKMEVYINGVYQGKTRLKISGLLPGDYKVELKKRKELHSKAFVTVRKGYVITYRFE